MKNIDLLIRRQIVEILVCFFTLMGSYVLWNGMDNEYFAEAKIYDQTSLAYVTVQNYENYSFYPMNDEVALKHLQPMIVSVVNDTHIDSVYHLVFRVAKTSTLDPGTLHYSVDNEVFALQDHFYQEDDQYWYYLIDQGHMTGGSKEYVVRIWLNKNMASEEFGHVLNYTIMNLDNILTA